ncbi:flp-33 [Pristionchus pacificus]|uniref:Uncharacterized protein n=1 Tax=Pristionchus pacificus TaxID=54126 RepID=A0A2A6CEK6_PRIPA|nr:flp-33 [Pristionchus pacificus]|eukprot:PDM76527.1 hypothetical protein PRIPAC_42893 [Pristionchus pacificus]
MTSSSLILCFVAVLIAAAAALPSAWPAEGGPAAGAAAPRPLTPLEREYLRELLAAERDFVLTNPVKSRRSPSDEGFDFTSALRSIDNIQKPRFGRRR